MSEAKNTLPLVDLHRQYVSIQPEIQAAINSVLEAGDFIMGKAVGQFEKAFAEFCKAPYAIGVASGTGGIQLILHALGIGPGDEVITVPHTFIATASPIAARGARPVFVDVEPARFTLDPAKLEAAITPRTRAIMPVHLYGQCADMTPILEITASHRIPVIEDAAQAHGADYHGKRAGTMGVAAAFSFYPGKNLGAYGDAGAITTNDESLAERLKRLRNHGRRDKYEHLELGYGERLDTLQAAILAVKVKHLETWNAQRRRWAAMYDDALAGLPQLKTPEVCAGQSHIYHQYVIQHPRRDALMQLLKEQGIQTGIHYPIPLHLQPALKALGYQRGDFPVTEHLADTILSLPIFPEMTAAEVQRVAGIIRDFCK